MPLTAVGVLILNDHVLKGGGVLPGWVTGKLSDVAGLFFFPLLLVAVAQGLLSLGGAGTSERWRRRLVVLGPTATGGVFAILKLFPATHAYFPVSIVADPTDLVALIAVGAAAWWLGGARRATGLMALNAVRLAAVGVAAGASAATSPALQYAPVLPYWKVTASAAHSLGCADAEIWVSKSGKTGLGLTLALRSRAPTCRIEVVAATLTIGDASVRGDGMPAPAELVLGSTTTQYLTFQFDNDAAWRAGRRTGVARLSVRANGLALPLVQLPLTQEVFAPHPAATMEGRHRVGCAKLTFEVMAVEATRLGLRATVEATEQPCQIRVDAARPEPSAEGAGVVRAPAMGRWHLPPATWLFELVRDQPPAGERPLNWTVRVDVTVTGDISRSLHVPVLDFSGVQMARP